jgi:hypothetical protein
VGLLIAREKFAMARTIETPPNKRIQYVAVGFLSLAAVGATYFMSFSRHNFFQPYCRNLSPLLVVIGSH